MHLIGFLTGEVLVIGDSGNDLDMLDGHWKFQLATVLNAEQEVKESVRAHGGYVASQPRSRGIIEIMGKMVFKKGKI